MLEQSVSSSPTFWAALLSWFTPTVFFLVLNLVIGTIFVISSLANNNNNHKHHHEQDPYQAHHHDFLYPQQQQQPLARSPSVLQRLKSINFYSYPYRSHEHENEQPPLQPPQLARSPSSMLQRLKSINLYSYFPTESFSSKVPTDSHVTTFESHAPEKKPHAPEKSHAREKPYLPEKQIALEKPHALEKRYSPDRSHAFEKPDLPEKLHALEKLHVPEKIHAPVEESEEEMNEENDDVFEEGSSLEEIYSKLQGQGGHFVRTHSDTKPASGEVPVKLSKKMRKSASSKSAFSHFKEDDIVESRRPATVREAKVSSAAEDDDGVDAKADDFINKFKQQLKLQRIDSIMRYKEMIGRGAAK